MFSNSFFASVFYLLVHFSILRPYLLIKNNDFAKILRRLTPRYRRASLLGPQEGFKNGFQNEAKLGGSGAHFG